MQLYYDDIQIKTNRNLDGNSVLTLKDIPLTPNKNVINLNTTSSVLIKEENDYLLFNLTYAANTTVYNGPKNKNAYTRFLIDNDLVFTINRESINHFRFNFQKIENIDIKFVCQAIIQGSNINQYFKTISNPEITTSIIDDVNWSNMSYSETSFSATGINNNNHFQKFYIEILKNEILSSIYEISVKLIEQGYLSKQMISIKKIV